MSEHQTVGFVGFVGLGAMGLPLAERLAQRFTVYAYDLDPARVALLDGPLAAAGVAELARIADVICTCLPSKGASKSVVAELVAAPDRRADLVVEMSTLGPRCVEENAAVLADAGMALVDSPISGGVGVVSAGGLAAMSAGPGSAVEAAMPLLQQVAKKVFVMGEKPGLGQVMKAINNAIALSVLPLTSEALMLGLAHGLGLEHMVGVINASSGRTQRTEVVFPNAIVPETFDHGATGEIVYKDVSTFVEAAEDADIPMLLIPLVQDLYSEFTSKHPNTDYSYVYRYIEEGGLR